MSVASPLPAVAIVTRNADGTLTLRPASFISAKACDESWEWHAMNPTWTQRLEWAFPRWMLTKQLRALQRRKDESEGQGGD